MLKNAVSYLNKLMNAIIDTTVKQTVFSALLECIDGNFCLFLELFSLHTSNAYPFY